MTWYPTPSDHRYANGTNHTMPERGGTYWALGGLDSSESRSPVTRGSEDRHGPSRSHANHLTSSAYASAPAFSFTQHQTQCDCPEPLPYQPLLCSRDPAEYSPRFPQILPGSSYHSGQYVTQPSGVAYFEDPPSDPNSFHHPKTYDTPGYSTTVTDGYGLPLGSQHQQILVSESSDHLRRDGSFGYYGAIAQRTISPLPSSCSSFEFNNAPVEIPSAELHSTSCASIALHNPSQPASKHFDYGELSQLGLTGMPGISMSNTASNGQNTSSSSSSQYSSHTPFHASNASVRVGQQRASSSSYSGSMYTFADSLTNRGFPLVTDGTNIERRMSNGMFAPPTSSPFPPVGYPRTSPLGHLHLTPPLDSSSPSLSLSSPSNPTLSHIAVPYTDSVEGTIGPNPIEAKHGATGNGQSFSPMTPLDSPLLTGEDQEQHLGTSMRRASTPHGHDSLRRRTRTMVPIPKVRQGVLAIPLTNRSVRRKSDMACFFCRERKIVCRAPPVGGTNTACKYVMPL